MNLCSELLQKTIERKRRENPAFFEEDHGVWEFRVEGDGGGHWTLDLNSHPYQFLEGPPSQSDVLVEIHEEDLKGLLEGRINGFFAFLSGRIRVKGNMQLASHLGKIFR